MIIWIPFSGIEVKKSKPVSRVLFPDKSEILSFIQPYNCLYDLTTYPFRIMSQLRHKETSSFASGTYLVFQLLGFTVLYVTIKYRELLPHIFTFTHLNGKFIFCGTFRLHFHEAFLLGSRMLCVARTFLLDLHHGDRTACISKIAILFLRNLWYLP